MVLKLIFTKAIVMLTAPKLIFRTIHYKLVKNAKLNVKIAMLIQVIVLNVYLKENIKLFCIITPAIIIAQMDILKIMILIYAIALLMDTL